MVLCENHLHLCSYKGIIEVYIDIYVCKKIEEYHMERFVMKKLNIVNTED